MTTHHGTHLRSLLRRARGIGILVAIIISLVSVGARPIDAGCGSRQTASCGIKPTPTGGVEANPADTPDSSLKAEGRSPRKVEFTYEFEVVEPGRDAEAVRAWVPLPASGSFQWLVSVGLDPEWPYEMVKDPEFGNHLLRIDLSDRSKWQKDRIPVKLAYTITRAAYRAGDSPFYPAEIEPDVADQRFLQPDRLVPIDGPIRAEAERVAGNATDPYEQARLLYDHIVGTLEYDKSGAGWGRGDALYACDARRGNCTDFHSLFVAEARALGIPARFVMGFPLPDERSTGEILGYHCWAEFHVDDLGWVPVDASEAHKHAEKRDVLFGGLDWNRIAFTVGRDITLPGASVPARNYCIYPYVEVDGREHTRLEKRFAFRDTERPVSTLTEKL